MAKGFHPLKVKEVKRETKEAVSVVLDVPESLKASFQFVPGQYLTFKHTIKGEEIRRSYSICSGINDDELSVAIKKVEEGRFSTFANEVLKKGDVLESMPPIGKFTVALNPDNEKQYVAFAAGSGITPIMSIIKSVMEVELKSNFILFYGNKGVDSIIFHEELEGLKNSYLDRLSVHHILSREKLQSDLFFGRIDGAKTEKFSERFFSIDSTDDYFLCGPYEMIMSVKKQLEDKQVDKKKIHFELFATPGEEKKQVKKKEIESFISEITIKQDGNTFNIKLKSDEESILDTALKTGADLPFACKGGVCATCKAKIESGKVVMDVNYGLEDDEIEAGYVLTCQAHPITEKVTVNFDG